MKLWSRGLGRTEVSMDFRYYKVVKDPETGNVCIVGAMRDPVNWEFRVMMEPEDIGGFAKMFFNWAMLWLVAANAFRYIVYLFKRKQYVEEGEPIEEKVFRAYNTMMRRGRPSATQPAKEGSKRCLNTM
ncbi:MAG: hypothetical protein JEZ02_00065 [Desulfatibacillum sp.]|nr:hypothetical protein [Desulfatibacillum sp.]